MATLCQGPELSPCIFLTTMMLHVCAAHLHANLSSEGGGAISPQPTSTFKTMKISGAREQPGLKSRFPASWSNPEPIREEKELWVWKHGPPSSPHTPAVAKWTETKLHSGWNDLNTWHLVSDFKANETISCFSFYPRLWIFSPCLSKSRTRDFL